MPTSILDSVEAMRKIDQSNMLSFCIEAARHYSQSAKNAERINLGFATPENIIIAGMGGSGIGGELVKDYARDKSPIPIEVSKDYQLPAYAGKKTLVLLVSYSGETEETLSAFLDAVKRKCMVFCVSSGGHLLRFAEKFSTPYLRVPVDMPPRAALPYLVVPLLKCAEKIGAAPKVSDELSDAIELLKKVSSENAPEKPVIDNFSKNLALNLEGVIPVVYGFGVYRGVAMRWKQQFNENSKVPAKWEVFSELDHNEIVGWEEARELAKEHAAVFVRDEAEAMEIRGRIENTKELVQPILPKTFEVWAQGKNTLSKMLSTILIGDFTSVYLAILRKVDPTPVKTIQLLKDRLQQNGAKEKILCELEKIAATSA